MANFIKLISKTTGEPETFQAIDEKLCATLGVPCDDKKYYYEWYDVLGVSGKSNIRDIIAIIEGFSEKLPGDDELKRVLAWIDQHYTLNTWCSR